MINFTSSYGFFVVSDLFISISTCKMRNELYHTVRTIPKS